MNNLNKYPPPPRAFSISPIFLGVWRIRDSPESRPTPPLFMVISLGDPTYVPRIIDPLHPRQGRGSLSATSSLYRVSRDARYRISRQETGPHLSSTRLSRDRGVRRPVRDSQTRDAPGKYYRRGRTLRDSRPFVSEGLARRRENCCIGPRPAENRATDLKEKRKHAAIAANVEPPSGGRGDISRGVKYRIFCGKWDRRAEGNLLYLETIASSRSEKIYEKLLKKKKGLICVSL